jgi:GDP-D-mannose dehydratase
MGLGNPGKARRELGWVAKLHMPAVVEMMIEAEMEAAQSKHSVPAAHRGE